MPEKTFLSDQLKLKTSFPNCSEAIRRCRVAGAYNCITSRKRIRAHYIPCNSLIVEKSEKERAPRYGSAPARADIAHSSYVLPVQHPRQNTAASRAAREWMSREAPRGRRRAAAEENSASALWLRTAEYRSATWLPRWSAREPEFNLPYHLAPLRVCLVTNVSIRMGPPHPARHFIYISCDVLWVCLSHASRSRVRLAGAKLQINYSTKELRVNEIAERTRMWILDFDVYWVICNFITVRAGCKTTYIDKKYWLYESILYPQGFRIYILFFASMMPSYIFYTQKIVKQTRHIRSANINVLSNYL